MNVDDIQLDQHGNRFSMEGDHFYMNGCIEDIPVYISRLRDVAGIKCEVGDNDAAMWRAENAALRKELEALRAEHLPVTTTTSGEYTRIDGSQLPRADVASAPSTWPANDHRLEGEDKCRACGSTGLRHHGEPVSQSEDAPEVDHLAEASKHLDKYNELMEFEGQECYETRWALERHKAHAAIAQAQSLQGIFAALDSIRISVEEYVGRG